MTDDPGPGGPAGVEVVGFDRTGGGFADLDRLVELARSTLTGEGLRNGRLDLVAVDVDEMTELNVEQMGEDGPTDVLSFPLDAADLIAGSVNQSADGPPLHLGDVVLCPDVARRQAPGHCGTEEAELSLLVIHGVLHVLGHDHAESGEAIEMMARERHHLAALGHPHPGGRGATW